ncbi:LuxR family transcriptional regulator [Sphingomonas sp. MA1305]|uniref:helix-turn-helix domain-containing protein n=1 Tax=Sphingomonas sp. MA1305 TaxID=2479204 RepID=UPI0018DFD5A4|nr:helix-turn-helix transcriptional regulator [Sphingomonas sp. MA1305]MBI0473983.1 LuxR family transcriptional regulator [Sphingomonas sp. MA1305]
MRDEAPVFAEPVKHVIGAGRSAGLGHGVTSGADIREDGGGGQAPTGAAASPIVDAPAGDDARFDRLTKRHRECLRGVRALLGSKEIAAALGVEKSTVDGYLTEAVRILGARNRRDAALLLAEHEASRAAAGDSTVTEAAKAEFVPAVTAPDKMGGDSARLAALPTDLPFPTSPDDTFARQPGVTGEPSLTARSPGIRLPFRRKGQRGNDLSVGDRLIWMPVIALGIAVGFGMLMTGLQALTGLIEAVSRTLS